MSEKNFNPIDVALTSLSETGRFANANKDSLSPEAFQFLIGYANVGREIRENVHKGVQNSETSMRIVNFIYNRFMSAYKSGRIKDTKNPVGSFALHFTSDIMLADFIKKHGSPWKTCVVSVDTDSKPELYTVRTVLVRRIDCHFVDIDTDERRIEPWNVHVNESVDDAFNRFLKVFDGFINHDIAVTHSDLIEYETTSYIKGGF